MPYSTDVKLSEGSTMEPFSEVDAAPVGRAHEDCTGEADEKEQIVHIGEDF